MIAYVCATPFHITAAITMQCGMFRQEAATLIVMNHFPIDDTFMNRLRATGLFDEVCLLNSHNRTLTARGKRAAQAVVPSALLRRLAFHTAFTRYISFVPDFLSLTYVMRGYRKRQVPCEFAFGDDGIGTYIRDGLYQPRPMIRTFLRLVGRLSLLADIRRLYVYKPDLMAVPTTLQTVPIEQEPAACERRRQALCTVWPNTDGQAVEDGILYFEQPDLSEDSRDAEHAALYTAQEILHKPVIVKLHPRSVSDRLWQPFLRLQTDTPYEVMLLQHRCAPSLMMSVDSTAVFSAYLFDHLPRADCPCILLYRLSAARDGRISAALDRLYERFLRMGAPLYRPDTVEQLHTVLYSQVGG